MERILALALVIMLGFVCVNGTGHLACLMSLAGDTDRVYTDAEVYGGNTKYLTDLASLSEFTDRDYTNTEIVDIKTTLIMDVDGIGTYLFVFLRETGPFEGNPDYDDGHSLNMYGPYFYERLQSAGVEREDLISCGLHFALVTFPTSNGYASTTQYINWMPLNDSYDGYSNVLIETYIPGTQVVIQDKDVLLGKH